MSDFKPTISKPNTPVQWKNVAAYVYLFICIFDFVIMPILTFFFHTPPASITNLITQINPNTQADLIKDFYGPWQPLTENDGGLFHIVFMTLLGVISWSQSKVDIQNNQKEIEQLKANTPTNAQNTESNTK